MFSDENDFRENENASDADMDESAAKSSAMTPTAIKTLQRNPRF